MDAKQSNLSVPMAIVVAGIIIAGAIFFSRSGAGTTDFGKPGDKPASIANPLANEADADIALVPPRPDDHILGSPSAPVVLIEYSDLECPFCKVFHETAHKLLDQYGRNNQLAWIYRHFPISSIHPKSPKESEAAECAATLGGNGKFWAFIDKIFAVTPSNNNLDPAELSNSAKLIGLDQKKFDDCLAGGKKGQIVNADLEDGNRAGINGTPANFLVLKNPLSGKAKQGIIAIYDRFRDQNGNLPVKFSRDGKIISIGGAIPLIFMTQTLDLALGDQR
jgi:protein-disulfide isomerase